MATVPQSPAEVALQEVAEINLAVLGSACRLAKLDPLATGRLFVMPPNEVDSLSNLQTMLIHEYAQTPCSLLHIEGLEGAFGIDLLNAPATQSDPAESVEAEEAKSLVRSVAEYFGALLSSAHRTASTYPRFAATLFHLPIETVHALSELTEMRLRALRTRADLRFRLKLGALRAVVDTFARESALPPTRRQYSELGVVARTSTINHQRKR